jgi:hypothetical protein
MLICAIQPNQSQMPAMDHDRRCDDRANFHDHMCDAHSRLGRGDHDEGGCQGQGGSQGAQGGGNNLLQDIEQLAEGLLGGALGQGQGQQGMGGLGELAGIAGLLLF